MTFNFGLPTQMFGAKNMTKSTMTWGKRSITSMDSKTSMTSAGQFFIPSYIVHHPTKELVREKLDARMVEEVFCQNKNEEVRRSLRELVEGYPFDGALHCWFGAELMTSLIDKGLPKWCWTGIFTTGCHENLCSTSLDRYMIGP